MATQPLGEVNQQLWDDALTRLLNLSTATVKRNAELENRLVELEHELQVWKQAHSVVLESSERETKAHNVQIASLNRQISNMDLFRNQNPLILCVIDGSGNVFSQALLTQGEQGGRAAAQQLTKAIAEYLSKEDIELLDSLIGHGICTHEQFDSFISGFSQASARFSMVDVGYGKDVLDIKIREYLQTYTRFTQTLRVFFGGDHDNGYSSTLTALENELLGKLVILQPPKTDSNEHKKLALPYLNVEGLFMTQKLPPTKSIATPLSVATYNAVTTNGGLMSPKSPTRLGGRLIDPTLPLHKQNPPPCNEHYLMSCSKGAACKYSHDYVLTSEQLASLASNAKKAPCNWLKNGLQCPYGENCCWGHICPNGSNCFHLSKGKCWFKGEAMHPAGLESQA